MIDEAGRLLDLAERQEELIRSGFFLEDWSRETTPRVDDAKWTVVGTGTGTVIRTVAAAHIYAALSGATNTDTSRLRGTRRWRVGPDTWALTSINRKLVVEFEAQFDTVGSIANATFFAGLSTSATATRTSDNLAGWILTADALNAITDDSIGETVSAVGAPAVADWHKLRMEIYASFITGAWSGHVDFYVDEVLQATHTTALAERLPDQTMYLNFYVPQEAAANGALNLGPVRIFYSQPPAPRADPSADTIGYLKAAVGRGMSILQGTCDSEMAASTTAIVSDDLAGFGDDYFNNHYYLTVIKNTSSAGATPENEARLITDYGSAAGAFTVDAFSANVEASDVFLILHETQMLTLAGGERLDGVIPADRDRFDVGDATAVTLRWSSIYISAGATDGLASIAGGKLNLDVLAADALPAEYGVRRLQTLKGRSWYHQADFSVIVTNPNANHVWAGLSVSAGVTWNVNNYIRIYKRQNNVPVEDIAVEYRLAGGAVVTTSILATTQDTMAFKIERNGDIWRCYYSLAIGSNHHWWVLAQEIEDPTDAMTDTVSAYISVYNPKDAVGQQITTTADDWEYFINLAVLENILTNISIKGGALAYLGYCNVGMVASTTVIACSNLAGFSNDCFNTGYQMVVLKNASALAAAPEMERRDITDYATSTGTFTTAAFSQNVEASDIVLVVHVSVASQAATYGIATGGAAGTIVDTMRTEAADYWNGMQVVMLSGNGIGQVRAIYDFDAAGDTIYVTPDFGGAVVAGDAYAILSHWTDLTGDDTAGNRRLSEVMGNKETAAVYDVDLLTSVMAYIKGLVDANITATGIADAGAAGSITDAARAEAADWWNGQTLLMLTGAAALQKRPITDFAAGVISVAPDFDGIPGIGDVYVILAHYNMIVPRLADALADALTSDVVGRKTDTADYTAGATQSSIVRFLKGIMGSLIIAEGVFTTSSATAPIDSARTEASNWFNNRVIIPLTGACAFQPRAVLQYTYLLGTGGTFTVDEAFTAATGAVAYIILSISYPATRLREIQGGTESLETLDDELDAIPDIAEVRTIASPVTLTGAVQYIYLNAPARPFFFAGGFISRASGAWATGETVIVTVDAKIDGTNYQNVWTATYLAEPSPILVPVPEAPWEFWNNGGGVRVGIVQSVVGAAFHTWNHSFIDAVPGS